MPNGVQEQNVEEGASGGESGEWHSDAEEDEESDDPSATCHSRPRRLSLDLLLLHSIGH